VQRPRKLAKLLVLVLAPEQEPALAVVEEVVAAEVVVVAVVEVAEELAQALVLEQEPVLGLPCDRSCKRRVRGCCGEDGCGMPVERTPSAPRPPREGW
jgi:hypothetical protein